MKRSYSMKSLSVPLFFGLVAIVALATVTGCSSGSDTTKTAMQDTVKTMSGLRYVVYEEGTGDTVRPGMTVTVDYAGYFLDGTLFDTSLDSIGHLHTKAGVPFSIMPEDTDRSNYFDRGGHPFEPIQFTVGQGQVIRGWDEGLTTNMLVGGRRRLIIPSDLAYGPSGRGGIPPNSTLVFDIHVLGAK